MAEEVKIVNISMTCFSQEGDQRGLENTDLLNKSYSYLIVLGPLLMLHLFYGTRFH